MPEIRAYVEEMIFRLAWLSKIIFIQSTLLLSPLPKKELPTQMVNNNRNSFLNLTTGASCSHSGFKDTGSFSAPVNVITFLFSPCSMWPKKKVRKLYNERITQPVRLQNIL